jgi:hypothetical protein
MKAREECLLKVFNRFAGLRTWMIKEKKFSAKESLSQHQRKHNKLYFEEE